MKLSITAFIVLGCIYHKVCGKLVELVVNPGQNATLLCDCTIIPGQDIHWVKICSFQIQPSLIISAYNSHSEPIPRYSVFYNNISKSYDLVIENITEADLGLYYCSIEEEKSVEENGKISDKKFYHNSDTLTKLTFTSPESPPELVCDCWQCWLILLTVCPVSSLLSAILALCFYSCCRKTVLKEPDGHQSISEVQRRMSQEQDAVTDIYYASLNLPKRGSKHPQARKKIINCQQSSDFSVYNSIKMHN